MQFLTLHIDSLNFSQNNGLPLSLTGEHNSPHQLYLMIELQHDDPKFEAIRRYFGTPNEIETIGGVDRLNFKLPIIVLSVVPVYFNVISDQSQIGQLFFHWSVNEPGKMAIEFIARVAVGFKDEYLNYLSQSVKMHTQRKEPTIFKKLNLE